MQPPELKCTIGSYANFLSALSFLVGQFMILYNYELSRCSKYSNYSKNKFPFLSRGIQLKYSIIIEYDQQFCSSLYMKCSVHCKYILPTILLTFARLFTKQIHQFINNNEIISGGYGIHLGAYLSSPEEIVPNVEQDVHICCTAMHGPAGIYCYSHCSE